MKEGIGIMTCRKCVQPIGCGGSVRRKLCAACEDRRILTNRILRNRRKLRQLKESRCPRE